MSTHSTRRAFNTIAAILAAIAGLLATAAPAGAHDADQAPAVVVQLGPNGDSGISATARIRGTRVTATATGLTPGARYISLYYGSMSTSVPNNPTTCADARTAALPRQWGITPEWRVNADGTGRLAGTASRELADGVFTISIRQVPAGAGPDPYAGFNLVQYPVRACGATRANLIPGVPGLPPLPGLPTLPGLPPLPIS